MIKMRSVRHNSLFNNRRGLFRILFLHCAILIISLTAPLHASRQDSNKKAKPAEQIPVSKQTGSKSVAASGPNKVVGKSTSELSSNSDSSRVPNNKIVYRGVQVMLDIAPLDREKKSDHFRDGDNVVARFSITDARTGAPIGGNVPFAWIDPSLNSAGADCSKKIAGFIGGDLLSRAAISLNAYNVLALNEDSTISVVDPYFEFGGTKLLALIALNSPGDDWVLTSDNSKLFVSLPDSNQVAVINTANWNIIAGIQVDQHPTRIMLQPDEQFLWVAYGDAESKTGDSGIAAINTKALNVAAQIPTGKGNHEIAFSDNNSFVFVTNKDDATVSVIAVKGLKKIKDIKVGRKPGSMAFSTRGKMVYVVDEETGSVSGIDPKKLDIIVTTSSQPGHAQIRFTPDGRFGLISNPRKNAVYVLDTANNQIIQSVDIPDEPDQIAFSSTLAYVRRRRSEEVVTMSLAEIGVKGRSISLGDFPGGQNPFGKTSRPSLADSIVKAPESKAVLVANPADKSIYYYMEGMAAPKGSFSNYKREPRAVLVVDRSLREKSPGVYETVTKLTDTGMQDVAFFLNSPRVAHCFRVWVDPSPEKLKQKSTALLITPLFQQRRIRVGEATRLQFKLTLAQTGEPKRGLSDLRALAFLVPGIWHERLVAKEIGDGVYEIEIVPPQAGVYQVYLESALAGLKVNNNQYVIMVAER